MIHINIVSLSKNYMKIKEFLVELELTPYLIAITEIKIKKDSNTHLYVDLPNYNFVHNDTSANAGGCCFYVRNDIAYCNRSELSLNDPNVEDLWLKVSSIWDH